MHRNTSLIDPECRPDAPAIDAREANRKVRLLTLRRLDGRTAAAKRTRDLIAAMEVDAGGSDRLSTGERQIIQRAAITGAVLEDLEARWLEGEPIDAALYATLGNAQRRLLETVGLRRVPRQVPSFSDLLREQHS
jgi:hypothetical protein